MVLVKQLHGLAARDTLVHLVLFNAKANKVQYLFIHFLLFCILFCGEDAAKLVRFCERTKEKAGNFIMDV